MAVELADDIWTPEQVARFLKCSVRKVMRELRKRNWRPDGIPWFPVGRDVRFWQSEVLAWAKERSHLIDGQKPRPKKRPGGR